MVWGGSGRAAGAPGVMSGRLGRLLAVLGAVALAGCAGVEKSAMSEGPRGATVAFESINGPPEAVFKKLVDDLNDEAQKRQLAVVSRSTPSAYRVRGYIAAQRERGKVSISWVWDVYDSEQRRALRITGTEDISGRAKDAWQAADDKVVRKIATASIEQLALFLKSKDAAPAASPASNTGFTLASMSSSSPEASGIFRIFQANADPASPDTAAVEPGEVLTGPIPLPPRRPRPATAAAASDKLSLLAAD